MEFENYGIFYWLRDNHPRYNLGSSAVKPIDMSLKPIQSGYGELEGSTELADLVRDLYRCQDLVLTSGACEANFLVYSTLKRGDEIIVEKPTFPPLKEVPRSLELKVKTIDRLHENQFQIDEEQLKDTITKDTKMVVVTNSHNPSGVTLDPGPLAEIASDSGAYLLIDEIYREMSLAKKAEGENIIITSSLSKTFGAGGLRIGWIIADETITHKAQLTKNYLNNCLSTPSEKLAIQMLRNLSELIERAQRITRENQKTIEKWVDKTARLDLAPSKSSICFPRYECNVDSLTFAQHLLRKYDTLVVPSIFFDTESHFRIGLGYDIPDAALKNIVSALDDFPMD